MTMSSSPPQISIIVPVYRVERYLVRCLDSILAQTFREIEVICVNDGSPDACPQILDAYAEKDSRVRVIHQENQGVSGARNAGMQYARARYIGFVDPDDWIEPRTYELAVVKMQEDEEIDLVCWGISEWVDRERERYLKDRKHPLYHRRHRSVTGKCFLTDDIKCELVGGVWNKLYKAELIQKWDIVYHEGHIYEDFAFIGEYVAWAKYGYCLDGYYYNYRLARTDAITSSASKNKLPVNTRFLRLFEEIYAYYTRFDLLESHAPLLVEMLAMMLRLCAQYSTDYAAFLREARQFVARYPNLPDTRARTFWYLGSGKAFVRFYPLSPLEKVFSVVNAGSQKIFRILGFEFAVDRNFFKKSSSHSA